MDEPRSQQTPYPEPNQTKRGLCAQLMIVTALSKYLAMALFVALPFMGFWLGMEYEQCEGVQHMSETLGTDAPQQMTTQQYTTARAPSKQNTPELGQKNSSGSGVSEEYTLSEILSDVDSYVGVNAKVRGSLWVEHFFSEMPCSANELHCNTLTGGMTWLVDGSKRLELRRDARPLLCAMLPAATKPYACIDDLARDAERVLVEGVLRKEQIATAHSGIKPIAWKDTYYLDIVAWELSLAAGESTSYPMSD